jgi:hypothetical protein
MRSENAWPSPLNRSGHTVCSCKRNLGLMDVHCNLMALRRTWLSGGLPRGVTKELTKLLLLEANPPPRCGLRIMPTRRFGVLGRTRDCSPLWPA